MHILFLFLIVILQASIRNTFFDQRWAQNPEVGVSQWRRQTDKQTKHTDMETELAQKADSLKVLTLHYPW